jgi:hypothetical protein
MVSSPPSETSECHQCCKKAHTLQRRSDVGI